VNARRNAETQFIDLGLIGYAEAWDRQAELFNSILDIKKGNRDRKPEDEVLTPNYLIFCEHPPVITMGKTGEPENLRATPQELVKRGVTYVDTNRGGDITFHGPGQLVAYPVFDLENHFTDISRYMRTLEEAVIRTITMFGIKGYRIPGLTGVWVGEKPRKICALGVKSSRWVTMHGLALNVNNDLSFFNLIVPCGIDDKEVTSIQKEIGREVSMAEVKELLRENIFQTFDLSALALK
jgi:lipoyl(octanoyl) transferase